MTAFDITDGVVEELPITQRTPDCGAPTVRMMAGKAGVGLLG